MTWCLTEFTVITDRQKRKG